MNLFLLLISSCYVFANKYIVQINNNEGLYKFEYSKFYKYEAEYIDSYFIIGDFEGYIMKYNTYPDHLNWYSFIGLIEEDQEVSINYGSQLRMSTDYDNFNELNEFTSYYLQQSPIWNLDRIDQRSGILNNKYYYATSKGSNVDNYIIDTGIDISHKEFEGRAIWGTNTVDTINNDCNGHGTHVSGTIGSKSFGVAKGTNLIAVKVLNCGGSGSYSDVLAGLNYVFKTHKGNGRPSVVNMSLGGPISQALNTALRELTSNGIHVVVAAGNSNADACNTSPASEESVMTVGASTSSDTLASFSNWGKCVNIIAPGTDIKSTFPGNKVNTLQGTSQASPHVAGIYSLILSDNKSLSPDTMKKLLMSRCTKNIIKNLPDNGTPNCLSYSLS